MVFVARSLGLKLLVLVAASSAGVLWLPPGHLLRVVAGLGLFIALPGIGLTETLLSSYRPRHAWERIALVGVLGVAGSSLASAALVTLRIPLSTESATASSATIAIFTALFLLPLGRRKRPQMGSSAWAVGFAVAAVLAGALVGSAYGTFASRASYTVFALADPKAASLQMQAARQTHGVASVRLLIESHESSARTFELWVNGAAIGAPFAMQPGATRDLAVSVPGTANQARLELRSDGVPYRVLQLNAPAH